MFRFLKRFVGWSLRSVIVLFLLSSCSGSANEIILERQAYSLEQGVPVVVRVYDGRIAITNSDSGEVLLSGSASLADPNQILTALATDGLFITAHDPTSSVTIDLQVPPGTQVKIDTYGADVIATDFAGGLDVTSTAGDITISNMEGQAVLRANRGDVAVESSRGEFHLPGNYGLLSLTDVSGVVEASTIMGTIRYRGQVAASDRVKLETDHGPVEAWLDPRSDVTVVVKTTTGVTDCVIPGLSPDGAGCKGQLGNGEGVFQVRTVSGEVDLKPTP